MATKVYAEEAFTLQDGTDVTVRPLPIARLRRFMEAWDQMDKVENQDDGYRVLVNCAGISLEHEFKGKFDSLKAPASAEGEFLSPEYYAYCEETLDEDTIKKVLEVAGKLRFNDPKMVEAAVRAAEAEAEKAGTN